VQAALKESGVLEDLALVNAMHVIASVFISEDERVARRARRFAPRYPVSRYRDSQTGEDNAAIMGLEIRYGVKT
jgi:hypothetical protein